MKTKKQMLESVIRKLIVEEISDPKTVLEDLRRAYDILKKYNHLFSGKLGGRDAEVAHDESTKFLIRLIHAVESEMNPKPGSL